MAAKAAAVHGRAANHAIEWFMVIANAPHSSTIQTGAGSAGRGDAYTSKPLAAATPSTTSPQASAASNTRKSALRTEEASHWQAALARRGLRVIASPDNRDPDTPMTRLRLQLSALHDSTQLDPLAESIARLNDSARLNVPLLQPQEV